MEKDFRHYLRLVESERPQFHLGEMAKVSDAMRDQTFYHGTPNDAAGQAILQTGLKPGNEKHARGHLTPVTGRTYLTPTLRYGIIYCIGGDMLGCNDDAVKYLISTISICS